MMKKQYAEIPYGYPPPYAYQRPSPAPEPYAFPEQKTRRKAKKRKMKPDTSVNGTVRIALILALIAGFGYLTWVHYSGDVQPETCEVCGAESKNYFRITVRGHVDYGAESVGEDVLLSAAAAAGGHVDTEEHFLCSSCYGRYIAFWRALS